MMEKENIYKDLIELLKQHGELFAENGSLFKNKVQELTLKNDKKLIELLLSSPKFKDLYFFKVGSTTIFDKSKFIGLVYNKNFLPDSYTKFSEKIGLSSGDAFIIKNKDVALNWPHKDCVLEGGMTKEDEKRDEIFWNEIIAPEQVTRLEAPKAFINAQRVDDKGSKPLKNLTRDNEGTIKDNLIIKGNNLLALHSLKEQFAGKIKLIYIDPPYNTENDEFGYSDNFPHSTWLTFMKNRFEVARDLLSTDGMIFVQSDDNEQDYLKVLMDEVFRRDNFICSIAIKTASVNGWKIYGNKPVRVKETITLFAKNLERYKYKRAYTKQSGRWDTHFSKFYDKEKNSVLNLRDVLIENGVIGEKSKISNLDINDTDFKKFYLLNKDKIFQTGAHSSEEDREASLKNKDCMYKNEDGVFYYNGRMVSFLSASIYPVDGDECLALAITDFWEDIKFNNVQNEEGGNFKWGKKPEGLIKRIIEVSTDPGDIVLDYHLGSGTTAAAAHKMGRQYIGVEQMDYIEEISCSRLQKVVEGEQGGISKSVEWKGGGEFVYLELAEWNQKWVGEIKKATTVKETIALWDKIKDNAFLSYKVDVKTVDENADDFKDLSVDDQKRFLLDCLDANHLYINYSEIDDEEYGMRSNDKELSHKFYNK